MRNNRNVRLFILGLTSASALTTSLYAQDWTSAQTADLTAAGIKYGVSMVRAIALSTDYGVLPPATDQVTAIQKEGLDKTLTGYVQYCDSAHVWLGGDRPHPIHQAKDPHHVVLDV